MKEIKLTRGQVALVDDEDYEWINRYKWHAKKCKYCFYASRVEYVNGHGIPYSMHRVILGVTDPKIFVDHKDRNGLNNVRNNIRVATRSQNTSYRLSTKGSSSMYLGVDWHDFSKRWRSRIFKNGKSTSLGFFINEVDAAIAYNDAAKKLHGEFANLNVVVNG